MTDWHEGVPLSARRPALIGIGIVVLWIGGFGTWAATAPLSGAVIAPGTFVATGQNKVVQHLEGGIVRDLLAKEGDIVEANQLLARMDDTSARSKLRRLVIKSYRLMAMKARLEAELGKADTFTIPATLAENADDREVAAIVERQHAELNARRTALADEERVLRKEIAGLEESIRGYEAQAEANKQRTALFAEELNDKNALLDRSLVRKSEVLALRRAEAGLAGDLGELTGRLADAQERVARAESRIAQLHSSAIQKAIQELRETEGDLDDVAEQIRAARDVVDRIEVRSPVRGIVIKRYIHTTGGVVAAGATMFELLPLQERLLIEAHIRPDDIAHVRAGQHALVRLSVLSQRITPMIEATVRYVSADALPSEQRSEMRRDFYLARVELDQEDARKQTQDFRPTPGMPADVYIETGRYTFLEYLMRPVLDTFSRAFRES